MSYMKIFVFIMFVGVSVVGFVTSSEASWRIFFPDTCNETGNIFLPGWFDKWWYCYLLP